MKQDRLQAALSSLDKPYRPATQGMDNFLAPKELGGCGGFMTAEAIDRVHEVMTDDLAGRADGSGRFRPSMIGDPCLRKQLLSYLGYPQDPIEAGSRRIMDAGTWRHYYWQAAGLSQGFISAIEFPMMLGPMKYGQADAILADGSLFEFKNTMDSILAAIREADRPKTEHNLQVHASMKATGIDEASLVYEGRGYLSTIEFRMTKSSAVMGELDRRLDIMAGHLEQSTLPPMLPDCKKGTGKVFNDCKFRSVCPAAGLDRKG